MTSLDRELTSRSSSGALLRELRSGVKFSIRAKRLLILTLLTACGHVAACQRIIQITLTFADGSAELDQAQIERLAGWVSRADAMFAIYESAGVEAGATVKLPGRTPEDAMRLARMRAENTTRALKDLFPGPIEVEQFSHSYRERKSTDLEVNDFAAIQLYPNPKTSKLPGCNPGQPDGLER